MKNLKNVMSFITLALVMLVSFNLGAQERLTFKDFEYIGLEHNNEVENIFNQLKSSKNNTITKLDASQAIKEVLGDRISKAKLGSNKSNTINVLLTSILEENNSTIPEYMNSSKKMSNELNKAFNDIDIIIKNSTDIKDFNSKINRFITSQQVDLLEDNDKYVVYTFASTILYSVEYWNSNLTKWNDLIGRKTQNSKICWSCAWDSIVATAEADAVGAAAGAIGALAVNIIPGLGQVAYGTAVVSTGVANSVISMFP
ncbi:hypothetical protein [Lacinutrix sp.]|uniref:hypothetical protein n=1 Tax=Lacinutrix sp. TaxID=1937692 RepID=UPI0025B9A9E1|nr:hypothetical protein [Lacinutrix sp.]